MILSLGGGHKLFYKNPVWCGNTKSVTHPNVCNILCHSPTPCQTGFLVTAWAQGPHSPAGLQGVKTSLWSPLKTTELSQYCVGISCLKLLTPGQGTEVWGDSEVNQGTSPEDCFSTASATSTATTATTATTSGGPTNLMRRSWLLLQYTLQPDLIQCFKDLNFIEWLIVYLRWPSEKSISG